MVKLSVNKYKDFEVNIIPICINEYLGINYIYILRCFKSGKTICIDPGEFDVVDKFLKHDDLNLDYIMITHKHYDHIGGIEKLKKEYKSKVIVSIDDPLMVAGGDIFIDLDKKLSSRSTYGANVSRETYNGDPEAYDLIDSGSRETMPSIKQVIGAEFRIGEITFNVFETLGHCANHVSYLIKSEDILFCGDTLFSSGCGRISGDGNMEELFKSMNKIKNLPVHTQIYAAHEYTLKNIEFALTLEPKNDDLIAKKNVCSELINRELPTLPTTLENEIKTNPFLRWDSDELRKNVGIKNDESDLEIFRMTRHLKDSF